ncbi:Ig-like domain-containing protein [Flavobacteriaceae bacterium MAR_2010_188]|nr:Ig-like domain-containing protein [Flavobacteriaceae bacterium MAR_2010_188]
MLKKLPLLTLTIISLFLIFSCANKKGSVEGGPKDIVPPKIVKEVPENYTTNFNGNEIRIYFNEYIKIKDLQKQLIVSPPMDMQPEVSPLGSANKYIKIIINDTLEDNTTYAFNFGQSIVDNNEQNPFSYYKYVFSTGDYIDSLSIKGQVFSADTRQVDKFISVMLYEVDSTYTDSLVYKQSPRYITNTLDSTTTFSLENLKAGRYKLLALKDKNNNFRFEQKADKIGYYEGVVNIPSDSFYSVTLFKEKLDDRILNPKQIAGQKISFGFEGDPEDVEIKILSDIPDDYEYRITKDKKTDTLYYWYKPKIALDSTYFEVKKGVFIDTLKHRFKEMNRDSLKITASTSGSIDFDKDLILEATTPLTMIDESKIRVLGKDSLEVPFKVEFDSLRNTVKVKLDKKESEDYKFQMLPETFKDFFGDTNDTLNYTIRTKSLSDFSNVRAIVTNATYPIIVQLTNAKDEVKYELIADENRPLDFRNIATGTYYMRVIIDETGNGKWDSGNYLKGLQPERIIYDTKPIEARANFDYVHDFEVPQKRPDRLKN